MNKTQAEINKELKDLLDNTSFDAYEYEDMEDADDLIQYLREQISEEEVIYYDRAMEYLIEHDSSLTESLSIAHDLGYTADNINSELLATLLQQQNLQDELSGLENEIRSIYES